MGHDHQHHHSSSRWKPLIPVVASTFLLGIVLLLHWKYSALPQWALLLLYYTAYLPVGFNSLRKAFLNLLKGRIFTEYFLMTIAAVVAIAIGEYTEGVTVMIFYETGEFLQHLAVHRSRDGIQELLDRRPRKVLRLRGENMEEIHPKDAAAGDIIRLRNGDVLALDGTLHSAEASLNTASLTGEPLPRAFSGGEEVLAGYLNEGQVADVRVTRPWKDSRLAQVLVLVQQASLRKAAAERFISRFAKIYTPVVTGIAAAVVLLPYFFVQEYDFHTWLYRGLIFLVISCPCALVISIPLGYFGGIGAASRKGILFKGSDYMDKLLETDTLLLDKTGTLTQGVPEVKAVESSEYTEQKLLLWVAALEQGSSHPLARAIVRLAGTGIPVAEQIEEFSANGIRGRAEGRHIVAGNRRMMDKCSIQIPAGIEGHAHSDILVGVDGKFAGRICLEDPLRPEAHTFVHHIRQMQSISVAIVSGDQREAVEQVAKELGITEFHGGLLPEDKVKIAEEKIRSGKKVAFAGDGINDAPVLALSHVGIAMGAHGADAAIESADVVIQSDDLLRIPLAMRIARETRKVVWQNIIFALGVKALVLALGAAGFASLWAAIFADVGVALLAILNAWRIQFRKFE